MIIVDNIHVEATPEKVCGLIHATIKNGGIDRSRRQVWTLGGTPGGFVTFIDLVYLFGENGVCLNPGDIFRRAINRDAAFIIVAELWPKNSQACQPENVMERLIEAGRILGIEFKEKIYVGESGCLFWTPYIYIEKQRLITWREIRKKHPWAGKAKAPKDKIPREPRREMPQEQGPAELSNSDYDEILFGLFRGLPPSPKVNSFRG